MLEALVKVEGSNGFVCIMLPTGFLDVLEIMKRSQKFVITLIFAAYFRFYLEINASRNNSRKNN
jgi:hypothetical protein